MSVSSFAAADIFTRSSAGFGIFGYLGWLVRDDITQKLILALKHAKIVHSDVHAHSKDVCEQEGKKLL